jgi:hypothetical protein
MAVSLPLTMSLTKTQIHEYCLQELTNRLQNAREAMAALRESVAADTKSSMGDKYETAREMAQQELEKISRQMGMLQQSLGIFNRIQSSLKLTVIGLGALIETDKGFFYMAAPLGKIVIQNQEIMVISPQSPAGKVMLGKKVGNSFELNGTVFQILSVA